jgi:hypothetical protein
VSAGVPTVDEIQALAEDSRALVRARRLVHRAKWGRLGADERAVWGVARGSRNYDVRVDLADLAPFCECVSARRVRYCKHLVGLLLYWAQSPDEFGGEPNDAVEAWLAEKAVVTERRRAREDAKLAREQVRGERSAAGLPPSAEDQAADARRESARVKRLAEGEARVAAGIAGLDLWLRDIIRDGVAGLETRKDEYFDTQARALVDAQASGLARRVASLAAIIGRSVDWPERMLDRLGRIALLADAYGRSDQLPSGLAQDLRRAIGWKVRKEEVLAGGERVKDRWLLVGRFRDEDEDGLKRERAWFVGLSSGRRALCLQFARPPGSFEHRFTLGCSINADFVFWPSAAPLRVTIAARRGQEELWSGDLSGVAGGVDDFLDEHARELAKVPWTWVVPCFLTAVPCPAEDGWWLRDSHGRGLPMRPGTHWTLAALTGGRPAPLIGEWDGHRFQPLAAVIDGRVQEAFEGAVG